MDLSTFGVSNKGEAGAAAEVVIRFDHLKRNQRGGFFLGGEGVSDFVLGWLVILYSVGFGGGGVNDF